LNSSPQPPSLEKRRGSKRLLPLSFKRGGRGVSSRGAGYSLIPLPFLTFPCPVPVCGTGSALWERVRVRALG